MINSPIEPQQSRNRKGQPSQEYALFDYVERLSRHLEGRVAVHVHLSRLQPQHRRAHHLRVATDSFVNIVRHYVGQIFTLRNSDIVFIAKGVSPGQLDDAVHKLRYLFSEDPLTQFEDDRGQDAFCTYYRLERNDYPRFMELARQIYEQSESAPEASSDSSWFDDGPLKAPLGPTQLGRLEEILNGADLSNLIRNQVICAVASDGTLQPIFDEMYVSITDLQNTVMPGVDFLANRWLFQYLTATLDRRVLAHLSRETHPSERAFSINLNVATLLSPEFQKFDQNVRSNLRGRLVIEVQGLDILADMGTFLFARTYVNDRGYRMCLDGVTHLTLPFIDREKLDIDLVKVMWSSDIVTNIRPGAFDSLKTLVDQTGPARMILCRCDSEQALQTGLDLGFRMFQGRAIDRRMADQRPLNVPRPTKG